MIVSGSRDLTCILWDMEELSYITQLAGHTTSVSALAINELTVSLHTCCSVVVVVVVVCKASLSLCKWASILVFF